jgi:hypothetical protein
MMNERPDGQTLQQLLERTLQRSVDAGDSRVGSPALVAGGSPVVVGEVLDTEDPQLPERVHVRWFASVDQEERGWLQYERHLDLRRGDRVLVTLPFGWAEWLVTGALGRAPRGDSEPATAPSKSQTGTSASETAVSPAAVSPAAAARPPASKSSPDAILRLQPGQGVVILGHEGEPLLRVHQGAGGPVFELAHDRSDQVELKAPHRLRLSAERIELAAGTGGVDIHTDGDAVVQGKAIRLN